MARNPNEKGLQKAIAAGDAEGIRRNGELMQLQPREIERLQKKSVVIQRRYGTWWGRARTAANRAVLAGIAGAAVGTVVHVQGPAIRDHLDNERGIWAERAHAVQVARAEGALEQARASSQPREVVNNLKQQVKELRSNRRAIVSSRSMTPKEYGISLMRFRPHIPLNASLPRSAKSGGVPGAVAGAALAASLTIGAKRRKSKKLARKAQRKARRRNRKK